MANEKPKKAYVIVSGEYSDYTVNAVFLEREEAERAADICNFCGCGCNARLLRYILKFLECFNYDGEGQMLDKGLFDKELSHPLMSDGDMWVSYEFLAKWVDSIGLSDHGTSVCSS